MSAPDQSLSDWVQTRLTAHYEASDSPEADFQNAFDTIFAPDVEIILNHAKVAKEEYMETMKKHILQAKSKVEWKEIFEVPLERGENARQAGIVAGFFVVTRSLKIRIRAAPAQINTFVSISAKVEQDPSADASGDQRRIVQLFQTSLDKAAPIHLNAPR